MRKIGLQSHQKQLDHTEIGQHDGSLDDEFNLFRLDILPTLCHAYDHLHDEDRTEDQFRDDVEEDHYVVLTVV